MFMCQHSISSESFIISRMSLRKDKGIKIFHFYTFTKKRAIKIKNILSPAAVCRVSMTLSAIECVHTHIFSQHGQKYTRLCLVPTVDYSGRVQFSNHNSLMVRDSGSHYILYLNPSKQSLLHNHHPIYYS